MRHRHRIGMEHVDLVVLGVGGYFGYRMLFPTESSSRVATSDLPAPAPAPEPPKEAVPAPQPPAQDAVSMKSSPAAPPGSEAKSAAKDPKTAGDMTAPGSTKAPGAVAPKMDPSKAPP